MSREKEAYTMREVADLLNVDYYTVRRAVAADKIRSFRLSSKVIRIPREEIEQFLARDVYTVSEAAQLLGLSQHALQRHIAAGKVRAHRFSRKGPWRIPRKEIDRIRGKAFYSEVPECQEK